MTQPIGILGGSFDPVHNGHLHLATTFLKQLNLAELRFIPVNKPAHRTLPLASSKQRLKMLKLATKHHAALKVDDCELQRHEISYTIDILKLLRKRIGNTPLCIIIGMDNFKTLNNWHKWQSIIDYAHIAIANRLGSSNEIDNIEVRKFMDSFITESVADLHSKDSGCIIKPDIPMLDISSTQIKNNFQTESNSNAKSLLPDKVLDFIHTHHLYNKKI